MKKKMQIKGVFLRVKRYLIFIMQYLFYEKPHGLDFTMRDTRLFEESNGRYYGYSKSSEAHIHDIFQRLSYEDARLLDVGCGKGVVLKEALKFPFQKIAGIEIRHKLVETAKRNFRIMGVDGQIECIESDAVDFDRYSDYNVFFLFNPFSEEILRKVADKILGRTDTDHVITIIYYNPRYLNVFENRAEILTKEMLHDGLKDYDTCILQIAAKKSELKRRTAG